MAKKETTKRREINKQREISHFVRQDNFKKYPVPKKALEIGKNETLEKRPVFIPSLKAYIFIEVGIDEDQAINNYLASRNKY